MLSNEMFSLNSICLIFFISSGFLEKIKDILFKVFIVDSDTVQLFFRSDGGGEYYGYYAVITPINKDYKSTVPYQKPSKSKSKFLGWNSKADGTGTSYVNEEDVLIALSDLENNTTLYAIWEEQVDHEITYDANNGEFSDSSTTNTIDYEYGVGTTTVYSHTPNLNDDGVKMRLYENNISRNDVITIPESEQLNIDLWFLTDSEWNDWIAIYPDGITPDQNNYSSATISNGRIGGHGSYSYAGIPDRSDSNFHKTYTVNGDTAQFYFRSDNYGQNYYGYYAIITGQSEGFHGSTYKMPTREGYVFTGWNTKRDGSGIDYQSEINVSNGMSNLDVNTTDNDGDTIIHTAIASEVYTGKIIPLLKELGPSFDVTKKDNNGNNIYEALLYYKKEAQAGGAKTKKWLERLSSEEKEIKIILKSSSS